MREALLLAGAVWLAAGSGSARAQKGKQPPTPKLKTTEFPDGTGTIGIPDGWRLDGAYRGTCGCKSDNGAGLIMGMGTPILRPDNPVAQMPETPMNIPRAKVGDLSGAIRSILEKGGARVKSLRSRPAPAASPGVPALYYLYEYQKPDGKLISSLGYFTTLGYPDSSPYWQLYNSYVYAPSATFMRDLPTMMAIWNTWRPNGAKPKAGSESAMLDAVLADNAKRYDETMKNQRESFERMQEAFRKTI